VEGLIGKRVGSKYDSKRSGAWIKIKLYQQGSFVIGGYSQPAGQRKHMGALLVGVNENGKLKFAGMVGTGFSEKLLKFKRIWLVSKKSLRSTLPKAGQSPTQGPYSIRFYDWAKKFKPRNQDRFAGGAPP
jgi:bifunctional non-homologous end joining protein LigD